MKPLVIELFAGRFGWSRGFIAEGYRAIGFDLVPPIGAMVPEGAELVIQDCLTLDGAQFKDAAIIVGSSPCQEFSYRAMPFKRCKALPPPYKGIELFQAQFRIQREANECEWCAGTGQTPLFIDTVIRHRDTRKCGTCDGTGVLRNIPLVVENVKGAQPWVGRAKAHFGSYFLWGNVESVGGRIVVNPLFGQTLLARNGRATKHPEKCSPRMWSERDAVTGTGIKVPSEGEGRRTAIGKGARFTSREGPEERANGTKGFSKRFEDTPMARFSSRSAARKAKSAEIAEIPLELARWIARAFKP